MFVKEITLKTEIYSVLGAFFVFKSKLKIINMSKISNEEYLKAKRVILEYESENKPINNEVNSTFIFLGMFLAIFFIGWVIGLIIN